MFGSISARADEFDIGNYDLGSFFDDQKLKHFSIGGGPNAFYYRYSEELTAPLKSMEKGLLFSALAEMEYRFSATSIYLRGRYEYTGMNTTYDGSTQAGTPVKAKTANKIENMEFVLGIPFSRRLALLLGAGYHHWLRRVGYDETYTWYYGVVGLRIGSRGEIQNGSLGIGLEITARPTVQPQMVLNYNESTTTSTPTFPLGRRIGFRAELPVDIHLSDTFSLVPTPWYEKSALGSSEWLHYQDAKRDVMIREPASKTQQFGLIAKLLAKF